MAKKFVKGTLLPIASCIACACLTYDASPNLSIGFTLITVVLSLVSIYVDKRYEVGIWEL